MFVAEIALPLTIVFLFILMNHGRHEAPPHGMPQLSSANFTHRVPPMWSPETETQYSFRSYMTDLSLWIMLTDLQPQQQASAIVMRLGGAARDMARLISPDELLHGGMHNGVMLGSVTFLIAQLHQRFAPLEEESRLTSMMEMMSFQRKPS